MDACVRACVFTYTYMQDNSRRVSKQNWFQWNYQCLHSYALNTLDKNEPNWLYAEDWCHARATSNKNEWSWRHHWKWLTGMLWPMHTFTVLHILAVLIRCLHAGPGRFYKQDPQLFACVPKLVICTWSWCVVFQFFYPPGSLLLYEITQDDGKSGLLLQMSLVMCYGESGIISPTDQNS
jgi:hypothetical protein